MVSHYGCRGHCLSCGSSFQACTSCFLRCSHSQCFGCGDKASSVVTLVPHGSNSDSLRLCRDEVPHWKHPAVGISCRAAASNVLADLLRGGAAATRVGPVRRSAAGAPQLRIAGPTHDMLALRRRKYRSRSAPAAHSSSWNGAIATRITTLTGPASHRRSTTGCGVMGRLRCWAPCGRVWKM